MIMAQVWHRVHARLAEGTELELFGGMDSPHEDLRVVDFSEQSRELLLSSLTSAYPVLQDEQVLGDFVGVFTGPGAASDEDVLSFYATFGPVRNTEWQEQFSKEGRRLLPEATQQGLHEPVWHLRELAFELEVACRLYWGLADRRIDVLRGVLGLAPTTGRLANLLLLGGRVHKVWATEEELARRVGSIGEWQPSEQDPGRDFSAEECFGYIRGLLADAINRYEAKAYRQWAFRQELPAPPEVRRRSKRPKPRPENPILGGFRGICFPSLIVALYLKLSDDLAEGRLLRPCRACGRYFHPDRTDQAFCKTRCSNAYRRRQRPHRGEGSDAG